MTQRKRLGEVIDEQVMSVINSGQFIMGPVIQNVENQLAEFGGVQHCVSCGSGTDALLIPLMAMGVGSGDAVFVPSFTFTATAEVVVLAGATPIFVDVAPDTFNISLASLKSGIKTAKEEGLTPKVIIPVGMFGQPSDMDEVVAFARENNLKVIDDAAQSFGSEYKGRKTGSLADVTGTSFFPAKPLGCYGDGGAIFSDDAELVQIMESIRVHGMGVDKYQNVRIGLNGRFDPIQAAIIIEKLKIFPNELEERNKVASRYSSAFQKYFEIPVVKTDRTSSWAQYTLRAAKGSRDEILAKLKEFNVPTAVYYPIPLNKQVAYKHYPTVGSGTPITEEISQQVFSLPMHPYLDEETQDYIIDAVIKSLP